MRQAGSENSVREHSLTSIMVELDQEKTARYYIQKKKLAANIKVAEVFKPYCSRLPQKDKLL